MDIALYPYKTGSESAKALAEALGIKRIKSEGSKYKGSKNKLVINWGCSKMSEEAEKSNVINKPEAVALASNKLSFFQTMREYNANVDGTPAFPCFVDLPEWTTSKKEAEQWIDEGCTIVCRTVLNGHSGQGIVIANNKEQLVNAPLYVIYVPKKQEYRLHVFMGKVVDMQRKARNREVPDDKVNWMVRNHDNGFIFARNEEPIAGINYNNLHQQAIVCVNACGLDFGAVDLIWNEKNRRCYILEINTAPGLSGETLIGYKKRFEEIELRVAAYEKAGRVRPIFDDFLMGLKGNEAGWGAGAVVEEIINLKPNVHQKQKIQAAWVGMNKNNGIR